MLDARHTLSQMLPVPDLVHDSPIAIKLQQQSPNRKPKPDAGSFFGILPFLS